MRKTYIKLVCFALVSIHPFCVNAGEMQPFEPILQPFEPITEEQYPALVFVQEDRMAPVSERSSLIVATFDGDTPNVQKIMAAESIYATQLGDAVFLVNAWQQRWDQAPLSRSYFLINFNTGSSVLLLKSEMPKRLSCSELEPLMCLLSIPDQNEAVLFQNLPSTDDNKLIDVDLNTLETVDLYTLPRNDQTQGFHDPCLPCILRISPDFKKLASMQYREWLELQQIYSLRVLDLETMQVAELDDQVVIALHPASSMLPAPSFEWISAQDIIYQHMIPEDVNEGWLFSTHAEYVLKNVNIETGQITELVRNRLPLTLFGGYIDYNWFTGNWSIYADVNNVISSPVNNQLTYSIKEKPNSVDIYYQDQLICRHKGDYRYIDSCLSHSQEHFAYYMFYEINQISTILYAITGDMEKPVQVAQISDGSSLVAWIEDTTDLRREQSEEN